MSSKIKYFIVLVLIIIVIISTSYSKKNEMKCKTITCNTNYYEIIIFKENNSPFYINVIGNNIDLQKFSNDSLQLFINNLYSGNNKFIPIIMNTEYYYKHCEKKLNSKKEELIFKSKINNLFINNKVILNRKIFLKSGEKIDIKGINLKGLFMVIDNNKLNFQNISLYPEEIYDCKEIKEYYIPLNFL